MAAWSIWVGLVANQSNVGPLGVRARGPHVHKAVSNRKKTMLVDLSSGFYIILCAQFTIRVIHALLCSLYPRGPALPPASLSLTSGCWWSVGRARCAACRSLRVGPWLAVSPPGLAPACWASGMPMWVGWSRERAAALGWVRACADCGASCGSAAGWRGLTHLITGTQNKARVSEP